MSPIPSQLERVFNGEIPWTIRSPDGTWSSDSRDTPAVVFPGSFNPLHEGHLKLAEAAAGKLRQTVCFEIAIRNAEKAPLDSVELLARLDQFRSQEVLVTSLPTFIEKSRHFPGSCFVVGFDTAIRILDVRFYGDSFENMSASLKEIERHGCSFCVAPRLMNGELQTLSNLNLSQEKRGIFFEITPEEFRVDVSSTELRNLDT